MFVRSSILIPLLVGCGSAASPSSLPDPDADLGLGDVELLVWTTRSPSGLLGHVTEPDSARLDAQRRVVDGKPSWVPTSQRLKLLMQHDVEASAGADAGAIGASAAARKATHVAYDVEVTGYLELDPDASKYTPSSGCCQGGTGSSHCGSSYVVRLIRGSGKVQYLQRLEVEADVDIADIVHARGGTAYRRLNETTFDDVFFAYQTVPLDTLCSRLAPGEEMTPLAVSAPRNCFVQAIGADGSRASEAWYVPDADVCRVLCKRHCSGIADLARCSASFSADGQAAPIALTDDAPSPSDAVVPAAGTGEANPADSAAPSERPRGPSAVPPQ